MYSVYERNSLSPMPDIRNDFSESDQNLKWVHYDEHLQRIVDAYEDYSDRQTFENRFAVGPIRQVWRRSPQTFLRVNSLYPPKALLAIEFNFISIL